MAFDFVVDHPIVAGADPTVVAREAKALDWWTPQSDGFGPYLALLVFVFGKRWREWARMCGCPLSDDSDIGLLDAILAGTEVAGIKGA